MMPATAQQVRAKLGFGADVPDEQLDDKAAERALSLSAEVPTLTEQVKTLTLERDNLIKERDEAKKSASTALALSADVAQIDPRSLRMMKSNFKIARDRLVSSGAISEAGMQELEKEFLVNGEPTNYAIQCSVEGDEPPRYMRVLEIIEKTSAGALKHNNQAKRPDNWREAKKNVAASADGTPLKEGEKSFADAAEEVVKENRKSYQTAAAK